MELPYKNTPAKYDVLAPDGSEVRLLTSLEQASSIHCRLPVGKVSQATYNKTVAEIWYILSGEGEIWRKNGQDEQTSTLMAGISLATPAGTHFQFRTTGSEALDIFIATFPPWPGHDEAVVVQGPWTPNVTALEGG